MNEEKMVVEKEITKANGGVVLLLQLFGLLAMIGVFIASIVFLVNGDQTDDSNWYLAGGICLAVSIIVFAAICISFAGLHAIKPNEAMVLTLFGKYYGTIKRSGFYYTNPFCSAMTPSKESQQESAFSVFSGKNEQSQIDIGVVRSNKISTKIMTLTNQKQKVNDILGNPIIIGSVAIWKVVDPTKALLNIDNYAVYLSTQCDSTIRNIARLYPYDLISDDDNDTDGNKEEKTLRGSSIEIAESMKEELQKKVEDAGIEIIEVRITHLSYSEEIAAAMLQRQQATAIIAARQKIVEGAVSMVKMAIEQLNEDDIVVLDEERKAAMVSNLLVVLCGNKEAQPIVNSGSIY